MASQTGQRTEVVRGRVDAELAERLVGFWTANGVLPEPIARRRLEQVVCVRRDDGGEIVATSSVYADEAPLVGRRCWIYRRYLGPRADAGAEAELLAAARDHLDEEFSGAPGEPIGLCFPIDDPALIAANPQAIWPDLGLVFAGYTERGAQVRVAYFEGARV